MQNKPVYMMAVAPHPHDAEWGIGGTVARWTREGKDVIFVICTNGDKGTSDPGIKPAVLAGIRKQEALESARLLGVKQVIFMDHPDLGLEDTPEFRKEILRLILTYRPEIVATRDPYFQRYVSNRDHRITGHVVLDSVWPYALSPNTYPDLIEQGLQLHKVKQVLLWTPENPNYRYDISATFELKKAALGCHKSQMEDDEYFRMITDSNKAAAQGTEFTFAEAFVRVEIPQRL
jgi:LmbE family N-acetylglucosaminyl deacetylase